MERVRISNEFLGNFSPCHARRYPTKAIFKRSTRTGLSRLVTERYTAGLSAHGRAVERIGDSVHAVDMYGVNAIRFCLLLGCRKKNPRSLRWDRGLWSTAGPGAGNGGRGFHALPTPGVRIRGSEAVRLCSGSGGTPRGPRFRRIGRPPARCHCGVGGQTFFFRSNPSSIEKPLETPRGKTSRSE